MRRNADRREVPAGRDTLGGDFALILKAFADGVRGIIPQLVEECRCRVAPRFAGWR
jgi:hypothetical protein